MSDTSTPQPEQQPSGASGAEAPDQAEQHAPAAQPEQAPPVQPQPQPTQPLQAEQPAQPAPPPAAAPVAAAPPAKVRRAPSDTVRLVVAAGVGAALLAIGGIGGYFAGAASHDRSDRPGVVMFGDGEHRGGPFNGRPGAPDRPGELRELPLPGR